MDQANAAVSLSPLAVALISVVTGTVLSGVIGFQVFLFSRIRANEGAIAEHKLYAANNYAKKTDLDKRLDRLEQKLDSVIRDLHPTREIA